MKYRVNFDKTKTVYLILFLTFLCSFLVNFNPLFAEGVTVFDIDKDGRIVLADGRPVSAYSVDQRTLKAFFDESKSGEPEAWVKKLLKKHPGMYVGEVYAITEYTISAFVDANKACREKTLPASPFFRVMLSGLNKIPNFKGTVYRTDFFQNEAETAQVERRISEYRNCMKSGKPFIALSILSTTLARKDTIKNYFELHNAVILEIKCLTGKRIQPFSARPEEEEVLFLPGTRFQVKNITVEEVPVTFFNPSGKSYRVFMDELK
ncbi:MAG: hypothetical protein HQM10_02920 [Candidatus Riflebacteria bacterium]|nr:hypothetical protein [Candidatus Riflebacteria bacterium]